jgi:SAM-dependent methyltransferase
MRLLIACEDLSVAREVALAGSTSSPCAEGVARLLRDNEDGCRRIVEMLASGVDSPPVGASVEEGVRFCRRLFDWSVQQSEEASVALYSLASPSILRLATEEIERLFRAWGLLGTNRVALDIGCGIGRLEEVLAPRLGRIVAVDVSSEMIAVAQRRCASHGNVVFRTTSGLDLQDHEDASYDLVFAVDSVPYLVQSGMPLVADHFAEVARVLQAGGDFLILNYSYRDEPERDREEVAKLALAHGFEVSVLGARPFRIWDATAFHLRKRPALGGSDRSSERLREGA